MNGGITTCQPKDISPLLGSILMPVMTPLKSVAYFATSTAVPFGMGIEKREAITEYSLFGVTNAEAWLPETLGIGPRI